MLREPGIPGGTEQRRQEGERGEPESALLVLEPHTVRFERERERDEGRERRNSIKERYECVVSAAALILLLESLCPDWE